MSNKKNRPRFSFDDANQRVIENVKTEVVDAGNRKAVAQTVADALTIRLAAAQALLARAEANAAAADSIFHDGQVATQTVINGLGQALAAEIQARAIHATILALYHQSYKAAGAMTVAADALDNFAISVNAQKAKNKYISANESAGIAGMEADSKSALAAVLASVQACMVALARADEAVFSASSVVREAMALLTQLLPAAADAAKAQLLPDAAKAGPVTNLRQYPLYQVATPSVSELADGIDAAAGKGVLYLLDALRAVRTVRRSEMSALNSEIGMELNAAQHNLEKASQEYDGLQAALNAATAALL